MILFMWLAMKVIVISLGDLKKNMVLHQVNTEKSANKDTFFAKIVLFKFNKIVYIRNRKTKYWLVTSF